MIDKSGDLDFITEAHKDNYTELHKVIVSIQRIRNNLFHGGKHGSRGEDDLERNKFLLEKGKIILDQLAELTLILHLTIQEGTEKLFMS
ncbi:hypothetical protein DKT75_20550 [Leucothrix arctica]|uniref:MAE-28990/MAE-18760-like HEPN domain-containing protein n=1 Tax=Leucothrix arctica TaxID=1481894 RepID=A0A317C6P7_9GAMM|nr:hypothetical protein DKT75_20550 [Leucothrix arctica]